ncbi:hypothetical protein DFH27DRAFT_562200 [Peziza echinospora]|nr:hypothetical protein DFH27DRAFT_562200 [Peziza echinospora]
MACNPCTTANPSITQIRWIFLACQLVWCLVNAACGIHRGKSFHDHHISSNCTFLVLEYTCGKHSDIRWFSWGHSGRIRLRRHIQRSAFSAADSSCHSMCFLLTP